MFAPVTQIGENTEQYMMTQCNNRNANKND